MAYTLTPAEITEVRMHLGSTLTQQQLSDQFIMADTVLGAAVDYVFGQIILDVNLDNLEDAQKTLVEALLDGTSDDIDSTVSGFVRSVLFPRQQRLFRRAVVYRAAGNSVNFVRIVSSETAGSIAQRVVVSPSQQKRLNLYERCDEQIELLRYSFPEDAIGPSTFASFILFG